MPEFYVGLMSGTSVDAIDAVLMDFSKSSAHLVSCYSHTLSASLRDEINLLIEAKQPPENYQTIDTQFAHASSDAVTILLEQGSIKPEEVTAIGSHGQTVFHHPNDIPLVSIQIGDPQKIARLTNIPTVGRFRQMDIDAGGQGAPLACAYHKQVLQSLSEKRVVLNLGGIANITNLPKDKHAPITGFDTGPANTLMDTWTQKHLDAAFDYKGNWAKSGKMDQLLLEQMLADHYFAMPPPKSTGREHFNLDWLQSFLVHVTAPFPPEDIQSTLLALTAHTIADSIEAWCPQTEKILLCGGGSKNTFLIQQLEKILDNIVIQKTDHYGVPSKWVEAMAFAWLAKLHMENKPGNIPSVTGANKAVKLGICAFAS